MKLLLTYTISIAIVLLSFSGTVSAQLIENGSFETGDFTGWTTNGGIGLVEDSYVWFGGASDGSYAVQMNDGNDAPDFVFEQTVVTEAGVEYELSFDYGRYDPDGRNTNVWDAILEVEVAGTGTLLTDLAIDSRQNLGGANDPLEPGEFLQFTASFVADSSSTTLRFADLSNGTVNADLMADNFQLSGTVIIDGCDSGVSNFVLDDGFTISDRIAGCAEEATNHGEFVSCVAALTNQLKDEGIISGKEKGAIQKCAAKSSIGK